MAGTRIIESLVSKSLKVDHVCVCVSVFVCLCVCLCSRLYACTCVLVFLLLQCIVKHEIRLLSRKILEVCDYSQSQEVQCQHHCSLLEWEVWLFCHIAWFCAIYLMRYFYQGVKQASMLVVYFFAISSLIEVRDRTLSKLVQCLSSGLCHIQISSSLTGLQPT